MDTPLYNQEGLEIGKAELPSRIFGIAADHNLIQQALVAQRANARMVIAHTKGRGEVRGGGKKPWRQKGTGRARHASIRSPIWKGGGVAFGPTKERSFSVKINKKSMRKALFMVLSSKIKEHALLVLDQLQFPEAKTKNATAVLGKLTPHLEGFKNTAKKSDTLLIIMSDKNRTVEKATRNIPSVNSIVAPNLNIKDALTAKYIILLQKSIPIIERTFKLS